MSRRAHHRRRRPGRRPPANGPVHRASLPICSSPSSMIWASMPFPGRPFSSVQRRWRPLLPPADWACRYRLSFVDR